MEGKTDYIAFVQWFQRNYPELYTCCCYSITASANGEGLSIDEDGLDAATHNELVNVTKEYYRQLNK